MASNRPNLSPVPDLPTSKRRGRPAGAKTHPSKLKLDIVDMVRVACQRTNRLAMTMGALFGAFIPLAVYFVAHREVSFDIGIPVGTYVLPCSMPLLLVIGGMVFSALTVGQWAKLAFLSWPKAIGFTVLMEGVMSTSSQVWLRVAALVYLCTVNAIATGVVLAKPSKLGIDGEVEQA